MALNKNIVSFITARGGSKGIPRKNIKLLNDKPLIAYSIESSINSQFISDTYVTTEDEEIAEISKKFGAKIIERPQELAEDDSSSVDVILHALDNLTIGGGKCFSRLFCFIATHFTIKKFF